MVLHSANDSPSNNDLSSLFGKHNVYRFESVYFFCLQIRSLISYKGNVGSTRNKIFCPSGKLTCKRTVIYLRKKN